jgi:hypothetical protein
MLQTHRQIDKEREREREKRKREKRKREFQRVPERGCYRVRKGERRVQEFKKDFAKGREWTKSSKRKRTSQEF